MKFPQKAIDRLWFSRRIKPLHNYYDKLFDIEVAEGCSGQCSYCAIRFGEGLTKSKSKEEILYDFNVGLKNGHSAFRLISGDVGAYGQDIGANIAELLIDIFKHKDSFMLMWDDFSPRWLIKYYNKLFKILTEN